jgi:hypothetical protein
VTVKVRDWVMEMVKGWDWVMEMVKVRGMLVFLDSSTRSLSLALHMSRILHTPLAGAGRQHYTSDTASMGI